MEETLLTFHRVLSMAGIYIFAKNKWQSKIRHLHQLFNLIICLLTCVFSIGFVIVNYSDLKKCIQGACIWTSALILFISCGICLLCREKLRCFLEEIVFKDLMLEMPLIAHLLNVQKGPERQQKIDELKVMTIGSREKLFKMCRLLIKSYFAAVFTCFSLYICGSIYILITEDTSVRIFAFDMWIPWKLDNVLVYVATFIMNIYCGFLCVVIYPGFQSTVTLMMGEIIRQLRILSFVLYHLEDLAVELSIQDTSKKQAYCTSVLTQCVDHFIKLKRFNNRLNVICQPFYLSVILASTGLVCACSVLIAISDKLAFEIMKYYVQDMCFVFLVLMFCLLGQQVQNECARLELAVTEKWYKFDKSHKVNVRIFEMAISQGMPIYIFGTITLSLPTFSMFSRVMPWQTAATFPRSFNVAEIRGAKVLLSSRDSYLEIVGFIDTVFLQFLRNVMSFFTLVMSLLEEQ